MDGTHWLGAVTALHAPSEKVGCGPLKEKPPHSPGLLVHSSSQPSKVSGSGSDMSTRAVPQLDSRDT